MIVNFTAFSKLGGAALITLGLAACVDISMDIEISSETEATATVITAMSSDIYAMISAQAEEGDDFCDDGELVETGPSVECIVVRSGPFDELELGDEEGEGPIIEAIGNRQVRVTFPVGELVDQVSEGTGVGDDPEMAALFAQMFEGAQITLSVSGGPIVSSNMEIADDGQSALIEIPLTDILTGQTELTEDLFAVVQK